MTGKQTTDALDGQWHKILGVIMHKLNEKHVVLTPHDIEAIGANMNVIAQELDEGLHIRLMTDAEVEAYQTRGINIHKRQK
jgi:hypothetical protein